MIHDPTREVVQEIVVETIPVEESTLEAATSREPPSRRLNPFEAVVPPPFVPFCATMAIAHSFGWVVAPTVVGATLV
jgi:hypothetical protein